MAGFEAGEAYYFDNSDKGKIYRGQKGIAIHIIRSARLYSGETLMRVGIDARLLSCRRGMGNLLYSLLFELVNLDETSQYILYTDQLLLGIGLDLPSNFQVRLLSMPTYPLWEQVALPLAVRQDRLDVLHCPANTGPLWLPKRVKLVLTIHDVMYLLPTSVLPASPSLYQRLGRIYRRWVVPRVVGCADAIMTVSHHSRCDILNLLEVTPERVCVIHEAPAYTFRPLSDIKQVEQLYGVRQGQFILALGGLDPRKNTARVLRAFRAFDERSNSGYQLVIVGLPKSSQRRFGRAAAEIEVTEKVIFTDFVPEEHLVALYSGADVFLYPSLYEGFGLPVLEAMACGTPVIASTAGSIPEIAGDAALLIEPRDVSSLALAMEQVITNRALRQELVVRGFERVKKFSWEKAAHDLLAIYKKVVPL